MRLFKKNGCKRLHAFFLDLCKRTVLVTDIFANFAPEIKIINN